MKIGTQLHLCGSKPLREEVIPVKNSEDAAFIKKPGRGTGLWTSTWREETRDSEWVEWCISNDYGSPYAQSWYLLTPAETANLYIIDGVGDLRILLDRFPWETERTQMLNAEMRRVSLSMDYGVLTKEPLFRYIDFERLAREYDGIWLTSHGNGATHLSYPQDLNSWDSESVLWFRWCFTDVRPVEPGAQP